MKAIFMLMVVALASPAFGQTTPPYDVTTAAGYKEWAIRYASALCTPSVDLDAQYLPAVDLVFNQASISFEWYQQTNDSGTTRWTMRTACSRAGHPKRIICTNATPYEGFAQSCAQLQLPPADAEISGSLPDGYDWSGRPPAPPRAPLSPEAYRDGMQRFAKWVCDNEAQYGSRLPVGTLIPGPGDDSLPAITSPSEARFRWQFVTGWGGYTLLTECRVNGSRMPVCPAQPIAGYLSCAGYGLPARGNIVDRSALPAGYNQYGEPPPPTARQPTTPEPEPEDPEDPEEPEPEPEEPEATRAWLEVPANGSFQSGIGFVSGWACEGERIQIIMNGGLHLPPVARNISRGDTEAVCGDRENGFILLWNWNLFDGGRPAYRRARSRRTDYSEHHVHRYHLGRRVCPGSRGGMLYPGFSQRRRDSPVQVAGTRARACPGSTNGLTDSPGSGRVHHNGQPRLRTRAGVQQEETE